MGDWHCISDYGDIGPSGSVLQNRVAYYVVGTEHEVSEVYMNLSVTAPDDSDAAMRVFSDSAAKLLQAAYGPQAEMPAPLARAFKGRRSARSQVAGHAIWLEVVPLPKGAVSGGFRAGFHLTPVSRR